MRRIGPRAVLNFPRAHRLLCQQTPGLGLARLAYVKRRRQQRKGGVPVSRLICWRIARERHIAGISDELCPVSFR